MKNILIVEDDVYQANAVRKLIAHDLGKLGVEADFTIEHTVDGVLLQLSHRNDFDLLIADYDLPQTAEDFEHNKKRSQPGQLIHDRLVEADGIIVNKMNETGFKGRRILVSKLGAYHKPDESKWDMVFRKPFKPEELVKECVRLLSVNEGRESELKLRKI